MKKILVPIAAAVAIVVGGGTYKAWYNENERKAIRALSEAREAEAENWKQVANDLADLYGASVVVDPTDPKNWVGLALKEGERAAGLLGKPELQSALVVAEIGRQIRDGRFD